MKWVFVVLLFSPFLAFSQDVPEDSVKVYKEPKTYHQIFLEEPVENINRIIHSKDSTQIQYRLSEDKKAIFLLNYHEGGIKAFFMDAEGKEQEIYRSRCNIHSLLEL